jgi:hypothetical protein
MAAHDHPGRGIIRRGPRRSFIACGVCQVRIPFRKWNVRDPR